VVVPEPVVMVPEWVSGDHGTEAHARQSASDAAGGVAWSEGSCISVVGSVAGQLKGWVVAVFFWLTPETPGSPG